MIQTGNLLRVPLQRAARRFSTLPNPPSPAFKWLKRAVLGTVVITAASGTYWYYRLKQVLKLRLYLTEEEVEHCREMAQRIIADHNGNLTPAGVAGLGPNLMTPYVPLAIEREKAAGLDVRQSTDTQASAEAKEVIAAALWGDKPRVLRAVSSFLLFLVYTPDQIEILLNSEEAKLELQKGRLLSADQIEQLRGITTLPGDEPPPWKEEE